MTILDIVLAIVAIQYNAALCVAFYHFILLPIKEVNSAEPLQPNFKDSAPLVSRQQNLRQVTIKIKN